MSQPQPPALDIRPDDVRSQKRVGRLGKHSLYHVQTKGGYNMILTPGRGPGLPPNGVLGLGPHPAVARFTAQKHFPQAQFTELAKSDWSSLSRAEMQAMLPEARRVLAMVWAAGE